MAAGSPPARPCCPTVVATYCRSPTERTGASRIAAERSLEGVDHLQRWLTDHLTRFLAERGRRAMAWDEVVDDWEPDTRTLIHAWRCSHEGARAAAKGYDVIMAPSSVLYFDHYQSDAPEERYAWGGLSRWEDVVSFDPFAGVDASVQHHVLGVQGQLWSEYLTSPGQVEYQALPRMCALAEVAWSGPVDPAEFEPRLRTHVDRLEARGFNVRPPGRTTPVAAGWDRAIPPEVGLTSLEATCTCTGRSPPCKRSPHCPPVAAPGCVLAHTCAPTRR